jgi:hypothetical protein
VTGMVLVIAVIAGLVLSVTAISLGLFMLLSKGHVGEAEGEWPGKVKVKGPVGLFVFCIGAALLVIIMRQITPPLFGDSDAQPPTSTTTTPPMTPDDGDNRAASTPGGARVEFIFPPAGYEINAGDDVPGSVQVTGLGSDTLWIVSRHEDGGSYYLVPPPIAKDGYSSFLDESVGNSSDKGSNIVYFAVLANADCAQVLSAIRGPFENLPPSCTYRGQRVVRVRY